VNSGTSARQKPFIVELLSPNIWPNCALCDKSTKFGTDVHWYGINIFRYWATENLTSVSAILDFKMAAAANLKLAIFLYLSQLQTQN